MQMGCNLPIPPSIAIGFNCYGGTGNAHLSRLCYRCFLKTLLSFPRAFLFNRKTSRCDQCSPRLITALAITAIEIISVIFSKTIFGLLLVKVNYLALGELLYKILVHDYFRFMITFPNRFNWLCAF